MGAGIWATDAHPEEHAYPHTHSDAYENSDAHTDVHQNANSHPHPYQNIHPYAHSDKNTDTHTHVHPYVNCNGRTNCNSDAHTHAHVHVYNNTDTHARAISYTDSNVGDRIQRRVLAAGAALELQSLRRVLSSPALGPSICRIMQFLAVMSSEKLHSQSAAGYLSGGASATGGLKSAPHALFQHGIGPTDRYHPLGRRRQGDLS